MNKKSIIYLSSIAIILATYNLILFLVRQNNSASFWVSYAFIMFAFVMIFASMIISGTAKNKQKVTGMNIKVLSYYYFIVQFVMGTIFMFFPNLDIKVCLIPSIIILAIYLLVFIPATVLYYAPTNEEK